MMHFNICILLYYFIYISTIQAMVYVEGPCPEVKPVEYFNMSAYFKSVWYEIARYPNDVEGKGYCSTGEHSEENGVFKFRYTEVLNGTLRVLEGHSEYAPNVGETGAVIEFCDCYRAREGTGSLPIYYVAVDYNKYAVLYECKYEKSTNKGRIYIWVLSRTKKLEPETKTAIENVSKSMHLFDINKLIWDDFEDDVCNV